MFQDFKYNYLSDAQKVEYRSIVRQYGVIRHKVDIAGQVTTTAFKKCVICCIFHFMSEIRGENGFWERMCEKMLGDGTHG